MDFILGAWVSAALTLFILSFLYGDNPLFKAAEHLYLGLSVGYGIALMIFNVWMPKIILPAASGEIYPLFCSITGLTLLARLKPRYAWVSRYGFAFIVGYAAGLALPAAAGSLVLRQIYSTTVGFASGGAGEIINSFIVAAGFVSVLCYFFFSRAAAENAVVKTSASAGSVFIMIYLGASFGATVMARFTLLYGRAEEMARYCGGEYFYAFPLLAAAVAVFLFFYGRRNEA